VLLTVLELPALSTTAPANNVMPKVTGEAEGVTVHPHVVPEPVTAEGVPPPVTWIEPKPKPETLSVKVNVMDFVPAEPGVAAPEVTVHPGCCESWSKLRVFEAALLLFA